MSELVDPIVPVEAEEPSARTPRWWPLILFFFAGYWILRYWQIQHSTPALLVLWVKKHDALAILTRLIARDWSGAMDALLRSTGLRWTRPVDPSA